VRTGQHMVGNSIMIGSMRLLMSSESQDRNRISEVCGHETGNTNDPMCELLGECVRFDFARQALPREDVKEWQPR
jgi:hypothetical protein